MSMNAIVILILAITMLGLGLTFMRGLFKQATTKMESAVGSHELTIPPTRDEPITAAPGEIKMRSTEQGKTIIAFMNTESVDLKCMMGVYDSSATPKDINTDTASLIDGIYSSAKTGTMTPDQINTWTIIVEAGDATVPTTQVVTAQICCHAIAPNLGDGCDDAGEYEYTKGLTVRVTS